MALHEIMFTSNTGGKIRIAANPIALRREEIFNIEGEQVITENFHFPIQYLFQWLMTNDAFDVETKAIYNIGFEDVLNPKEDLTK